MIYVFDFDDTLTFTNKNKIKVPRQTFHQLEKLKKEKNIICIISYNPYLYYFANILGLTPYFNIIFTENCERYELIKHIFNVLELPHDSKFFYYDDRFDNIQNIEKYYINATCFHITDPLCLYKYIQKSK